MKKIRIILLVFLVFSSCILLSSCFEDTLDDLFSVDTERGLNALKIDLGNGEEAIYYLDEDYGLWTSNGETVLLIADIYKSMFGDILSFNVVTRSSYYRSKAQHPEKSPFFYSDTILECTLAVNDDDTSAVTSRVHENLIPESQSQDIAITKIYVPEDTFSTREEAIEELYGIKDSYFAFMEGLCNVESLYCETADLWIYPETMRGEWTYNGISTVAHAEISENVPYITVYKGEEDETCTLLEGAFEVVDDSTIKLIDPIGEMFYTPPTETLIFVITTDSQN